MCEACYYGPEAGERNHMTQWTGESKCLSVSPQTNPHQAHSSVKMSDLVRILIFELKLRTSSVIIF